MPDPALVDATHVATLAGGRAGARDGNPQMAAFCFPGAVAVDGPDVWVAEVGRAALRVLRAGMLQTVHAGRDAAWAWSTTMADPGLAMDPAGAVWVAGWTPTGVVRLDGEHPPTWLAAPEDGCLAIAPDGLAWVRDGEAVRAAAGVAEHPAPGLALPLGRASASEIGLYLALPHEGRVLLLGDAGLLREWAFTHPVALAADPQGHCVVVDQAEHRVWILTAEGDRQLLAGDGTPGFVDGAGRGARFDHPSGVALTPDGEILIADRDNHAVRRLQLFPAHPAPVLPHEPPVLLPAPGELAGRRLTAWRWDAAGVTLELGYARARIADTAAALGGVADLAAALTAVENGGPRIARLEVTQSPATVVKLLAFDNGLTLTADAPLLTGPEAAHDPWLLWLGRTVERYDALGVSADALAFDPPEPPPASPVVAIDAVFTWDGGCFPVSLTFRLASGAHFTASAPMGLAFQAP